MSETIYPRSATYVVGSTASAGPFGIPFPFVDEDEIAVHVNGEPVTAYSVTVASRYGTEGNSLTLEAAVSNATVVVSSDVLPARSIGDAFTQVELARELDRLFYLSQEASERAVTVDPGTGVADIGSGRIQSTADPVEDRDMLTLGYAERVLTGDAANGYEIERGTLLGQPWRYERDETAPPAAAFVDTAGRRYRLLNDELGLRYFDRDLRDGGQIGTALLGFIDYASETGRAAGVIPPGLYELEQAVAADVDGIALYLRGCGRCATGIWADSASVPATAISLTGGSLPGAIELADFTLGYRGQQQAGSWALDLPGAAAPGYSHRSLALRRLDLAPAELLTGEEGQSAFAGMIRADHHMNPFLGDVHLQGGSGDWPTATGLQIDGCTGTELRQVSMHDIATGLSSLSDGTTGGTLSLDGCLFDGVQTGLDWQRGGMLAQIVASGSTFLYRDAGVKLDGAGSASLSRCGFTQQETAPGDAPADISSLNVASLTVDACTHDGAGDARRIGIQVGSGTDRTRLTGSAILPGADMATAFDIADGAGRVQFEFPRIAQGASVAQNIVNADGADLHRVAGEPLEITLTESDDFDVIANAVWAEISFDASSGHELLDGSAGASGVTVPAGLGISHARVIVNSEFDSNTTGNRGMAVLRDGGIPNAGAQTTVNAVVGRPTSLSAQTAWFPVSAGQVLGVQVVQTSGGDLALTSPSNMSVEFR
ncbi:hypothetical protein [Poseidonocella sp. HB161398]|uniref:hypothetical protein n=1 Tax=Poseidonocella sp. HB161398 TaxID=2320855 RepID=UPI00110843FD|nr:hypothetical protein [Poseidonocella sp. HB161398]